jgi:hypothetical protein
MPQVLNRTKVASAQGEMRLIERHHAEAKRAVAGHGLPKRANAMAKSRKYLAISEPVIRQNHPYLTLSRRGRIVFNMCFKMNRRANFERNDRGSFHVA